MKYRVATLPQGAPVPPGEPRKQMASNGYVVLYWSAVNGQAWRAYEHRVVLGNPIGGVVHHKNGIKTDNRPENLEWLQERAAHNKLHRTFADEDAAALYESGRTTTQIAETFGAKCGGNVSRRLRAYGVQMRNTAGERNRGAKLKEGDVRAIRAMRAAGVSRREVASQFGISVFTVSKVVHSLWRSVV